MASSFAQFAPDDPAAGRPGVTMGALPGGWRLALPSAALWALAVATLMSTQYLAQPFVWANWPVDDVLLGWLEVARGRVLVALSIALALALVTRVPAQRLAARAALIVAGIVVGAVVGEFGLYMLGAAGERTDASSIAGRTAQWVGLGVSVAAIYGLWVRQRAAHAAARASELQRSTAQALLVQTQLQSLRHQIDPHFLFNTLATIRRLSETDAPGGERLLHHLLDYLRSTTSSARQRTTLGEEADLAASYLAIAATRMAGRLDVAVDVPDALRRHPCPPLALATLVENAVKHGITPAPDGGGISVAARRDGDALEIVVADTGVGIGGAMPASAGGAGIGLANVRARLRALHGGAASLAVVGNAPRGVRAVIRMPYSLPEAG